MMLLSSKILKLRGMHSDYFLTSDKNLIKYRIPSSFGEVGFFKPETMPLDTFRDTVLGKTS